MRLVRSVLVWLVMLATAGLAEAQSTSGTISGRVMDAQGGALPGVTVIVESPSLQGVRTALSTESGDYVFPLLPSGAYVVAFELSGFDRQSRAVSLAPTQVVPLDVTLGVAGVQESVVVTGRSADVSTLTPQAALNIQQELISQLPGTRDVTTAVLLAPSVHATGPGGTFSISGSMTFESLYMINGVTATENIRGQIQQTLVIEDAIQETNVATSGISAEFGRFSGGVVNVITKSGSNRFSGSFRDTLNNDKWRALVPKRDGDLFNADTKIDDVVPLYEYTFGGPVLRDKLWFFTAGRAQTQRSARQLVLTNIPYTFTSQVQRYEGKVTYAANPNHRFQGAFTKVINDQSNSATGTVVDVNSLVDRGLPETLTAITYTGVLSPSLFVEGRYSARDLSIVRSGARSTDRIDGTLLISQAGRRFWSPTFCGVCTPEERDNRDIFAKASYFLSTKRFGAHHMVAGVDSFNDKRWANNHQSGSDYILQNVEPLVAGGGVYMQTRPNTVIRWRPIIVNTQGNNFRTHSVFYNDAWVVSPRLTANLGLRWDRNDGTNGAGELVAKAAAWSPRVGVVFTPGRGDGLAFTASAAKYVAATLNSVADTTSAGGNPDLYDFLYLGPSVNADPNGPLVPTDVALRQIFSWFDDNGGVSRPITGTPAVRGVTSRVAEGFRSPSVVEYAGGVSRAFGAKAMLRADFIYRDFSNFYAQRTDTSTGTVVDARPLAPPQVAGRTYDLTLLENTSVYERQYAGLSTQGTYRWNQAVDLGATYTLSRTWGNVDGESFAAGPLANDLLAFPEYKLASWAAPSGDLSVDQRHRARIWANYRVPVATGLTISALQTLESGAPYGAVSATGVDPRPYVTNPGYLNIPSGQNTTYFYTDRDAFRTEGQRRTDLAINYTRSLPGFANAKLFGQLQVINLFNQFQLCGCGGTVFVNGGGVDLSNTVDQTVRTSVTNANLTAFNPFTTAPVEDVNWSKGPNFGRALTRFAYTSPRQLRLSFGIRF